MDFVILIALISVFPNVYRAELPLPSCSTEKPFRMDSSICSSFKEVCIKTDSSQCRTLLDACNQCPPSEYNVSMLATLNMKINELSNLTKKNLSDLSSMTKKDISDLSSMLMKNISELSNLTKKNLSDLSNLTKKDISDLSSMLMKNISEQSNLTNKNLSELNSIIKKIISDLSIMQMNISELSNLTKKNLNNLSRMTKDISDLSSMLMKNISELFNIKKEMNDTQASAMKGMETKLSNHHSWLVGLLFGEIIIIIVIVPIITVKNHRRITKCCKTSKRQDPTNKENIPLMESTLDEYKSSISSELKTMLKAQEAINAKLLTDSQKAQTNLAELNSKVDEINKSLVEKNPPRKENIPLLQAAPVENMNTISSKFGAMLKAQEEAIEAKLHIALQKAQEDYLKLNSKLDKINKSLVEKVDGTETGLISTLNDMSRLLMEREKTNDDNLNSRLDIINKFLVEKVQLRIAATELPGTIEGACGGTDEDILLRGTGEPK